MHQRRAIMVDKTSGTKRTRRGVTALAIVVAVVFAAEVVAGVAGSEAALVHVGALKTSSATRTDWWRVLTFSFLHLNAPHLLMNEAALLWIGGIVERRTGTARMLIVFAVSAVASGISGMLLARVLPTTGVAVGASGAIYGLLAAALMLVFGSADPADRSLRGPLMVAFFAAVTVSVLPGVSAAGHLGGFVGGALALRTMHVPLLH